MAGKTAKKKEQKLGKGMAIAAMVCGIIALVFFWSGWFALICAIVALVLGIIALAKKADGKGMAIAGVVTGGCGLLASSIVVIVAIIAINAVTTVVTDAVNSTDWSELESSLEELNNEIESWDDGVNACLEKHGVKAGRDYDKMTEAEQDIYWDCLFNEE